LEARLAFACAYAELAAPLMLVEISLLGSRQNNPQVSALFKEEGKYAR
jgi:hypothetical protein